MNADTIISLLAIYGIIAVLTIWFGMIVWTLRDIKLRSRDTFTRILSTLIVTLLNLPGLILYLFIRPKETLSEAYEKSLEEEALLQEIEEKLNCPGCGQAIKESWQICPNCHTQLKSVCINCRRLIDLNWDICPYCTAHQGNYREKRSNYNIKTKRAETPPTRTTEFVPEDE